VFELQENELFPRLPPAPPPRSPGGASTSIPNWLLVKVLFSTFPVAVLPAD
jgi:hypothetical protein